MAKEIETLAAEIDAIRTGLEHGRYSNEAAVSQGIVSTLLSGLGWKTSDTTVVYPEYGIDTGRVDYALCHPPLTPIVLIEVKRVGKIDGAEEQLFSYAFHQGRANSHTHRWQDLAILLPIRNGSLHPTLGL